MCIYICVYIHLPTHIRIHIHTFKYICLSVCMYVYVCMYVCMYGLMDGWISNIYACINLVLLEHAWTQKKPWCTFEQNMRCNRCLYISMMGNREKKYGMDGRYLWLKVFWEGDVSIGWCSKLKKKKKKKKREEEEEEGTRHDWREG